MIHSVLALLLLAFNAPVAPDDETADAYKIFKERKNVEIPDKFTFVRIQYDSEGGYGESWYSFGGRDWERWETDYPEAEENFLFRLSELTTIEPNPRAIVRRLTDEDLFNYPFIYMCDVGWMRLTKEEKAGLREYLLRGGFLWVDDFWGWAEWESLESAMKDVLPNLKWRDIPNTHPILNMVFPMDGCPQIPARIFAVQGWTSEPVWIHKSGGVDEVHFRGLFDETGRLLVVATHNTDIGDGFEREAEGEWYFQKYSTKAYALGINIIVYALTH
ncbi:MAG: DUF4159 domain-containing protein [Acidobacteriota bacterium]|nr:DUF4159 domain-containing protein [Acidobacteriota bacterium]